MTTRHDLSFVLDDDVTLGLIVKAADGTALDLTNRRIEIIVKPTASSPDGDALFQLSTVTGGPPRITVTNLIGGLAQADLTNLATPAAELWYEAWVADIADPDVDRHTFAYGNWLIVAPGTESPCGISWVDDVNALCPCSPSDFDAEGPCYVVGTSLLEQWGKIASLILYARTGRRWRGVCTDTVRPCSPIGSGAVQSVDYVASGGSRPLIMSGDDCSGSLGCCAHSKVLLPHVPVRQIVSVEIDGAIVPSTDYTLVDRRWLVKASGSWPCHQNLGLQDGEPDTWSVTYEWGETPPVGGSEMAGVYACELAKGCAGDDSCRLPRRVQSITREGVTQVIFDPFDFLDSGLTGLYEVDAWVKALNPAGIDRAGKMLNPDLLKTHRVR